MHVSYLYIYHTRYLASTLISNETLMKRLQINSRNNMHEIFNKMLMPYRNWQWVDTAAVVAGCSFIIIPINE